MTVSRRPGRSRTQLAAAASPPLCVHRLCPWGRGLLQNVRGSHSWKATEIQYQPPSARKLFLDTYEWLKKWSPPSGNNVSLCLILSHFPQKMEQMCGGVNHGGGPGAALQPPCQLSRGYRRRPQLWRLQQGSRKEGGHRVQGEHVRTCTGLVFLHCTHEAP